MSTYIVQTNHLTKLFPVNRGIITNIRSQKRDFVHAVDDVTFSITKGETFSLVGETGSGKTTTGRLILGAIQPTKGTVLFDGEDINKLSSMRLRELRQNIQLIFQDPTASLDPRMKINKILAEPLEIHKIATGSKLKELSTSLLEQVGLKPAQKYLERYPHELSGGQKQRVVIARSIALRPKFVVADEPVSSLDISIRSEILNLLQDLKDEFKMTYLYISHDLSIVKYMSDTIAIMYLGRIVEIGPSKQVFEKQYHPYTKALFSATPKLNIEVKSNLEKIRLKGDMPSPINIPSGCRFHTRCPFVEERCIKTEANLKNILKNHQVACHLYNI